MHSDGLILSWNWLIQVYTPYPLRQFWKLPVTNIHIANVPFILMILCWILDVASASGYLPIQSTALKLALYESSKVKSHCHSPTVANWLTDEKSIIPQQAIHWLLWNTCPDSHHYCLQVHLQTHTITASKLSWFWPPSVSPNSHKYGLQGHRQTRTMTASKLALSRPPSLRTHGLQVYLQTSSITASRFTLSWPLSASLNLLVDGLQPSSIVASKFTGSCPPSAYLQTR